MTKLDKCLENIKDNEKLFELLEKKEKTINLLLQYIQGKVHSEDYQNDIKIKESQIYLLRVDLESINYEIELLEIKSKKISQSKVIGEMNSYYENFSKQFQIRKDEMEKNFNQLMAKANIVRKTNTMINNLLSKTNWDYVNSNIEAKVDFYEIIKKNIK